MKNFIYLLIFTSKSAFAMPGCPINPAACDAPAKGEVFVASGTNRGVGGLRRANLEMLENAALECGELAAIQLSETYLLDVGTFVATRAKFECRDTI